MESSGFGRIVLTAGLLAVAACLGLLAALAAGAKEPKRAPTGLLITVYAPHPEPLELALDEVELDWSGDPAAKGRAPAAAAVAVAGATLEASHGQRAVFRVAGVSDKKDLWAVAVALKAANPRAEAHLVLYEPGRPQTDATRRLLTREVALLLEPAEDPRAALAGLPSGPARPVPGVPDAYVVDAADPVAALDLAAALGQRPGVRSAYPLLKRQAFPR